MTFDEAKTFLLKRAREIGVDAEILATETRELTLEAFEGTLSQITQATQGGIGLRVVTNGKTGYAYSEERSEAALTWALDEAKENAELQLSGDGFLPQGQALGRKDLLSEGLSAPLEEKVQHALDLETGLRQDRRVKQVVTAHYSEREATTSLASTMGASGEYRDGVSALGASVLMQEGKSVKESWNDVYEKEFHNLQPGKTALDTVRKTGRLLGAKSLQTGRMTAYLEPKAGASLLHLLLFILSGKSVMEGKSRLGQKLGIQVASDLVTLVDDPLRTDGLASRPFDSEGTPGQRLTLIQNGVLKSFMHNSATARATGQANTGHASRSYRDTLGVGPSNLTLEPGSGVTPSDGVIVTELMGLHAGANPISGDFSLQGLGLKVEGGEIVHPVEDFAMSGNLLELLVRVVGVGAKLEWTLQGAALGAPMLEVADVSFAGS